MGRGGRASLPKREGGKGQLPSSCSTTQPTQIGETERLLFTPGATKSWLGLLVQLSNQGLVSDLQVPVNGPNHWILISAVAQGPGQGSPPLVQPPPSPLPQLTPFLSYFSTEAGRQNTGRAACLCKRHSTSTPPPFPPTGAPPGASDLPPNRGVGSPLHHCVGPHDPQLWT